MSRKNPRSLHKLESRRVQAHVETVLSFAITRGNSDRAALRCRSILSPTWETLDLYTLAVDLAEEDDLRFLVAQARAAILGDLIKRSESQRSSRCRHSSQEATSPSRTYRTGDRTP